MNQGIQEKLKFCRLSGMVEYYEEILEQAKKDDLSYEEFFLTLLDQRWLTGRKIASSGS